MNEQLAAFIKSLIYWLAEEHTLTATVKTSSESECELDLVDEDDTEIWVGNYADAGVSVRWLGEFFGLGDPEKPVELVRVNSVVIQALGRHVAGWIAGYS